MAGEVVLRGVDVVDAPCRYDLGVCELRAGVLEAGSGGPGVGVDIVA